jgi:hypothetical protein
MAFDLILRNGRAVVGGATVAADVGVTGEVVSAVGEPGSLGPSTQELDIEGRYVVPGGVDPPVHTATELGEFTTLDGFEESTRAAAWGGTTTIVDWCGACWSCSASPGAPATSCTSPLPTRWRRSGGPGSRASRCGPRRVPSTRSSTTRATRGPTGTATPGGTAPPAAPARRRSLLRRRPRLGAETTGCHDGMSRDQPTPLGEGPSGAASRRPSRSWSCSTGSC